MSITRLVAWLGFSVAALVACGPTLNQTSGNCPAGRTLLDGVCVSDTIADYVACVRAQGAQLGAAKNQQLSAEVGYLSIRAGGAAELSESLQRKYQVSDAATLAVINGCNSRAGVPAVGAPPPAETTHQCALGDLPDCTRQCERGHASSCNYLGLIYEEGAKVGKDLARSAALFKVGCDANVIAGCANLARALLGGVGVSRDPERAFKLYQWACDHSDAMACNNLGAAIHAGEGGPKDESRAMALYDRACALGEVLGCNNLVAIYREPNNGKIDRSRVLKRARELCSAGAQYGCDRLVAMGEKP